MDHLSPILIVYLLFVKEVYRNILQNLTGTRSSDRLVRNNMGEDEGGMKPLPERRAGSDEPLYNIGAVSRMTGITMATLRAWERRYDFPEAQRTLGGHRLYTENDVLRLEWVKGRIEEGMQTGQAIQALRHQEKLYPPPPAEHGEVHRVWPEFFSEGFADAHHYSSRLLEALLENDTEHADQLVGEALAAASPDEIIVHLIGPVMSAIGEAWEQGRISVANEHLATNYLRQRLLMWMLSSPMPRPGRPVVLACAPGEWHEGSLLMLGALLRRRGWPVAYLGQAVPLPDLAQLVQSLQPRMVVLVAMIESTAQHLLDWPQHMVFASDRGGPVVAYGGRVFTEQPEWRARMPGVFLGSTLQEGMRNIEKLLEQTPG
jgi:MerR family transcriptional regulator, light-induced transcriptional regulator